MHYHFCLIKCVFCQKYQVPLTTQSKKQPKPSVASHSVTSVREQPQPSITAGAKKPFWGQLTLTFSKKKSAELIKMEPSEDKDEEDDDSEEDNLDQSPRAFGLFVCANLQHPNLGFWLEEQKQLKCYSLSLKVTQLPNPQSYAPHKFLLSKSIIVCVCVCVCVCPNDRVILCTNLSHLKT